MQQINYLLWPKKKKRKKELKELLYLWWWFVVAACPCSVHVLAITAVVEPQAC